MVEDPDIRRKKIVRNISESGSHNLLSGIGKVKIKVKVMTLVIHNTVLVSQGSSFAKASEKGLLF